MDYIYKTLDLDPPDPDRDRFEEFIKNSKYVISLLYHREYNPIITKRGFTEKLTKHPEDGNMEYLTGIITQNNGSKNLVIAPTGSGKTYSIDAIFKQLKSDDKQLLCLLCPNRVQNLQNESSDDYSFEALIEGVRLEETNENTRQVSAVYDKILDIRRFKKEHPDYSLRIVIDECQNLISANIFRKKAMESIIQLIKDEIADSYTFITATYDSMCCMEFDSITLFEDKNYKPVFQSVDVRFASAGSFENLVMDTALKESKPYIRLNSKDMIQKLNTALRNTGKNSFSVTSTDKGYTTNPDGSITYDNIIFDHITNNDDLYNREGEADIIFATSLLDAGTNFTRYSPQSTPVFAVFNPRLMNLDEIEQAFNRFRPQKDVNGNIIQLNHAVIIQNIAGLKIHRARVMQVNEQGKNIHFASIPPKAVSFTDTTSKEERNLGKISGLFSIPGKYLSELNTGKYNLDFVIGNGYHSTIPLYVNCKPNTDVQALSALLNKLDDHFHNTDWSVKENANLLLDMSAELVASVDTEYSFFYQTGDEAISAHMVSDFVTPFHTLTYMLKLFVKEAKSQLARFHNYKAADSLMADAVVPTAPSANSNVTITLPSLIMAAPCKSISIRNDDGERIVYIISVSNEKIHFTNSAGKDLICIENSDSSVSVSIFGGRYTENGAMAETYGQEIKIIPASDREDAEKAKCSFSKTKISPIIITDTIHQFKIMFAASVPEDNVLGGLTEIEYLESLLNMLKEQKPEIGEALYFTKQMKLRIDYMKLFNNAYTAFQNQYYYFPNRLIDELGKRLNIPITYSYYQPQEYSIKEVEEDRELLLCILKQAYLNPLTKDILCDVLHYEKTIPIDLDRDTKEKLASLVQSNLYKKEYKVLRKLSDILTFDYIVKVLANSKNAKSTNKHIKRIEYMLINQAIARNGSMPFSTKSMKIQFTEQSTLISVVNKRKQASGTKKFTLNESFMDSLNQEFNKAMQNTIPSYKPKSSTQFKNLLYHVYNVINQNSKSRKPELAEPILSIDDVPFD